MPSVAVRSTASADLESAIFYELNRVGPSNLAKAAVDGNTRALHREENMGGKRISTATTLKLPIADTAVLMTDLFVDGAAWRPSMDSQGMRVN